MEAAASGTPLAWVGTGTTSSQYFTSAIVSFSPSPILTGADKTDPGAVYTKVVATVAPAVLAQSVSVDKYVPLPGGTGDAQTGATVTRNTTNGTITFDVGGTAGTAPSMPKGDLQLEAKEGGTVLGTDMVIVQIPKAIGNSVYTKYGGNGVTTAVDPTNMALNINTSPSVPGIPANEVGLFTGVQQTINVPVVDQFGNALGSEYNGQEVYETINNAANPVTINQKLKNGSYNDPVGFYSPNPMKTQQIVPIGSQAQQNWLAPGSQQATITVPQQASPHIAVTVAGFSLAPTMGSGGAVAIPGNRIVTYGILDGQYVLTVKWNAP